MKAASECPESVPSPGALAVIEMFAEEARARARPPGIDDWCRAIDAEARRIVATLPCVHGLMVGDKVSATSLGWTYVIQAVGGGLVKIGRAKHSRSRLANIQACSPVRLEVVAIAYGPELERIWHKQFYRQRVHGEWFAPEVADYFRGHSGAGGCVRCSIYGDKTADRRKAKTP